MWVLLCSFVLGRLGFLLSPELVGVGAHGVVHQGLLLGGLQLGVLVRVLVLSRHLLGRAKAHLAWSSHVLELRIVVHLFSSDFPVMEIRYHLATLAHMGHAVVDLLLVHHARGGHLLRRHLGRTVTAWLHRLLEDNCLVVGVVCVLALVERVVLYELGIVLKLGVSDADVALERGSLLDHPLVEGVMRLARLA